MAIKLNEFKKSVEKSFIYSNLVHFICLILIIFEFNQNFIKDLKSKLKLSCFTKLKESIILFRQVFSNSIHYFRFSLCSF